MIDLYRSWPAVSHTSTFITSLPIFKVLYTNSTPIVAFEFVSNLSVAKRFIKFVFPTPLSPTTIIFIL